MTLKSARLARAEMLTPEQRQQFQLPSTGLVIIESRNDNLHANIISAPSIREYLLTLGDFKDIDIIVD